MTISVAVADDQALVRIGFCGIIAATEGLAVVGEAANGAQAVTVARTARPDVMLMDVRMPELDGIEATRQIMSDTQAAGTHVIILTTFDLDEYVFGALRAGASGFLLKDTLPADLITAITRRLISEFARTPPLAATPPVPSALPGAGPRADKVTALLTYRECQVLRLVTAGLSNAEIAGHLHISPATAKTHVAHLLTKLDARDRVQLVILAYQAGLATA